MFDYESMIKRAIKFFPTWSNIRKKVNTSNGGRLLSTITDENIKIKQAIQDYIDFYFINKYEEDKKEVMTYCYRTNIGNINNIKSIYVQYNNEIYSLDTDIDKFNNNIDIVFYENGYIYIREELYSNIDTITVIMNNNNIDYNLEKYHIWNIYDEFACFIGMQRHENETNQELYKRMLFFNSNKANSSEDGLKNAIISELMIYEPELTKNDIVIEKVTPENLRKPYKDFNELLDYLNKINRDVYRWKKWDIDEWTYEFKTLDYVPYKWDEALTKWQNGIGHGDDLNVIVSNNIDKTDLDITLYEKSQEKLLSYIQNNNIYKSIGFNLKSYRDILNSININYRIQASSMTEINVDEFDVNIYENTYTSERLSVEELYSIGNDIIKIDNSTITDIYPYKIQFTPKNNNYDMEIKKCRVIYKKDGKIDSTLDLMKPNSNFILNSLDYLVNTGNRKIIKNINSMNSSTGLINIDKNNGFTLSNNTVQGSGSIDISGLGGNIINYVSSCELSDLPKEYIQYNSADCIWNNKDKELRLINNGKNKIISIDINANQLSFDVSCNNSVLVYIYNEETDNWNPEEIIGPNATWKMSETQIARRIKIKIESNSNDTVILSNFRYSKYEIIFDTAKNKIEKINNNLVLPNIINNTLYFKIVSYSGLAPVVNGIYIGESISELSYFTDTFEYKNGCTRILEIVSNCNVNLHKLDLSNNTVSIIENYNTNTSYKAISDSAYIRLNLDSYNEIDSIIPNAGSIDIIEESGVQYYNIKLSSGDNVSYIDITGNKDKEKETITLKDLITTYNPNFDISKDKVYCSRLAKGLIISKSGSKSSLDLIQLDSSLFKGLDIMRYEFVNIPDNLNIIWGSGDNEQDYSFVHTGDFNYISFYDSNSVIHTAINNYSMLINEMKDIKIVNNFNPALNTSELNYYEVEPFNNQNNVEIKFYNYLDSDVPFNKLLTWSIGLKNLYIKCNIDLLNTIIYNVSESYVLEEVKLNQLIPIKQYYNNDTVQTNKFIIEPDSEDIEVIYDKYDGTSNKEHLLKKEVVEIQNDGFKKLQYSNIDKILYIGTDINGNDATSELFNDYILLNNEGILIWNNLTNNINKVLYIVYTIKDPIALKLSDEYLYKTISYNVNAYKEIAKYRLSNLYNGDTYNLNKLDKFKECDLVYTSCSEPTFEAIMIDDKLKINKYSQENNILIKTGYYYINGKEYYLFSNDGTLELNTNNHMFSENVNIENGKLLTYKTTDNRVKNSSMIRKGINNLFNFDYKDTMVYGISNFSKYTSCDSFDRWVSSEMDISFTDEYTELGCNDTALLFTPKKDYSYAFIEVTDFLYDNKISYISFISSGIDVYIAEEEKYLDIDFPNSFNMKIKNKISSNTNLKIHEIEKANNTKYYLVVTGHGVLDDIIITDNLININTAHNRNIDMLGFNLNETKQKGNTYRISIDSNEYYNSYQADIYSDGSIKTSSKIQWNITKLLEYNTRSQWLNCDLNNISIDGNILHANDGNGSIFMGEPIYIENPYTINRLIFKVNNIDFDYAKEIKISIYTSNERNGQYRLYTYFDDNYGFVYGDYLSRYIKVKLDIPSNKIVDNLSIYAEYKSEEPNIINAATMSNGYIMSTIFNSQQRGKYRVKEINIGESNNIEDINVSIRGCSDPIVWSGWKDISLSKLNEVVFNNVQFFQIRISINSKYAYLKFNYIDLEVL